MTQRRIKINGFGGNLLYDGHSTISVCLDDVSDAKYDDTLNLVFNMMDNFPASRGSEWGCDGVGYYCEKSNHRIKRNKSGIGPRNFKKICKGIENYIVG